MREKNLTISLLFFFVFTVTILKAQRATVTTGGQASGGSGTVSYSIGQLAYITNVGSSGRITQGVQQPHELFSVGIKEFDNAFLVCQVYPNPTSSTLSVKVENYNFENLSIQLYDVRGKLILTEKITGPETIISLEHLSNASYYLTVQEFNKELKSFQIIKN